MHALRQLHERLASVGIIDPGKLAGFERIALRPTSMEREVLPELAADDELYSRQLAGFWMNVKKPREWIEGNALYLSHLRTERPAASAAEPAA